MLKQTSVLYGFFENKNNTEHYLKIIIYLISDILVTPSICLMDSNPQPTVLETITLPIDFTGTDDLLRESNLGKPAEYKESVYQITTRHVLMKLAPR